MQMSASLNPETVADYRTCILTSSGLNRDVVGIIMLYGIYRPIRRALHESKDKHLQSTFMEIGEESEGKKLADDRATGVYGFSVEWIPLWSTLISQKSRYHFILSLPRPKAVVMTQSTFEIESIRVMKESKDAAHRRTSFLEPSLRSFSMKYQHSSILQSGISLPVASFVPYRLPVDHAAGFAALIRILFGVVPNCTIGIVCTGQKSLRLIMRQLYQTGSHAILVRESTSAEKVDCHFVCCDIKI